ncbi:hypothetical protein [Salinicoccus albus]|nr:hypothetical protein [Salinicoccus albus]
MKNLLVGATLSITVAAVIKRVTEIQSQIDVLATEVTTLKVTQK